jgi:hypothetical protein
MMSRIVPALVAVLLLLPGSARAQIEPRVRVTPQVGLLTPADWFYYEVTGLGQGPMVWTESAVLRSTMVGATAEIGIGETGLWLRASFLRTLDGETYVEYNRLIQAFPDAPRVEEAGYYVPTAMTLGSVELGLPTRFQLPFRIQPYFVAGVGGKRYSFDNGPLDGAVAGIVAPEDGTSLMGILGGGLVVPVGRFGIDLQVRDALSKYWDDLQHDIVWSAGLAWRVF